MERVGTLIDKLKDLFDQGAGSEQLLATASMLLAELEMQDKKVENRPELAHKSGVSVFLPQVSRAARVEKLVQAELPLTIPDEAPVSITKQDPTSIIETVPVLEPSTPSIAEMNSGWLFDTSTEIPTLALHQKQNEFEEIHQLMKSIHSMPGLNEKLKVSQQEVSSALNKEPIKELKKGIAINDRFLFVQELFRGDDSMYERSIKTIDSFSIYPEAQFWIQRELKLKIGWNEDSDTVKHFDQLVKRRFS
jgi:hypothetical protein